MMTFQFSQNSRRSVGQLRFWRRPLFVERLEARRVLNAAPVAEDDTYQGLLGQSLTVGVEDGVLANDVDADNDTLTALVVEGPSHGQLTFHPDGSFGYAPDLPAAGLDRFTYRAHDGSLESQVTEVNLSFSDDVYSTPLRTPLHVGLVNGSFETGDLTGWTTFTSPGGTLGGIGFPDVVPFDTDGDTVETRSAQFLVGDGGGGILQEVWLVGGDVRLSANVAVRSPVAADEAGSFELWLDDHVVASHDFGSISAGQVKLANLTAAISNVSAGPHEIRVRIVRQGPSSFGSTPSGYVDDVLVFGEAFGVLANDRGSNVELLRSSLLTFPEHGTIELRDDGSFRYLPDSAFEGQDGFLYKAVEQNEGITLYTVDTQSDKLLKVDSQSGQIEIVGAIGHDMGSVDLVFNNGLLYALNERQNTFELLTIDPATGQMLTSLPLRFGAELKATKGITAVAGQFYVILAHRASYCGDACGAAHVLTRLNPETGRLTELVNYRNLSGGFRHDWDALTTDRTGNIIAHRLANQGVIQTHQLEFEPPDLLSIGELHQSNLSVSDAAVAGTDHFILSPGQRALYRFEPEGVGYSKMVESVPLGPVGAVMRGLAFSPALEAGAATVTIAVSGAGSPMAAGDSYQIDEDTDLSALQADGVLINDNNPQGDPMQAVITRGPLRGAIQFDGDGSFHYTPSPDSFGLDFFQYQAVNGAGVSNVATVTINVHPSPDAPLAVDDTYEVYLNDSLAVSQGSGLLANDRDPDADPMTVSLVDGVTRGTLTLLPNGSFTYQPELGFLGVDQFTYRANDGQLLSDLATVMINVRMSPPPVAMPDVYDIDEDELLVARPLGVLANDEDPNGDAMTALLTSDVVNGTLSFDPDGTFTYLPEEDFFGVDSFSYRASDGTSESDPQTVLITVHGVNDAPISRDEQYMVPAGQPLDIPAVNGVLANDEDVEDSPLSAVLVDGPEHGTLTLNNDGSFRYVPGGGFTTTDSFTYRATDGEAQSEVTTVTLRADIPTIDVGQHFLRANAPGQKVEIFVTGGQIVSGADLFVMVGDGGPELVDLGLPAGTEGPRLSAVDLKTDTIFATIADQPIDLGSLPQVANWSISSTTVGVDVEADGLLATLTFDTTGFIEGTWDLSLARILPNHPFGPFDTAFAGTPAHVTNGSITVQPTQVLARHIFYNNSAWDGKDPGVGPADDAAIAADKSALQPGETATFDNYTSYSKGINGLIIDIARLPDPLELTLDDFEFRVGRNNDSSTWSVAPPPSLFARPGEGVDGSDRITLVWPDNAIQQQWLEVRLKTGARTLLPEDEVFYFGNAIGETGNDPGGTLVTSIDVIATRDHQRGPFDLASVDDVYDFNRDRIVSSIDVIVARDHQVGPLKALPLISPTIAAPAATPAILRLPGDANQDGVFDSQDLVRVFQSGEFEDLVAHNSTWPEGDWDGDGDFTTSDLVWAFQAGGYRLGSQASLTARPEAFVAAAVLTTPLSPLPSGPPEAENSEEPRAMTRLSQLNQVCPAQTPAAQLTGCGSRHRDGIVEADWDDLLEEDWLVEDWWDRLGI